MFYLITGGSGSGKSAFAEDMVCRLHREEGRRQRKTSLLYIATMIPYGDETRQKILRHQRMRADKGFVTVECYTGLKFLNGIFQKHMDDSLKHDRSDKFEGNSILLECMSNLVANELYEPAGAGENTVKAVLEGVGFLLSKCSSLVIVTNDIFEEPAPDSVEMRRYRKTLGEINLKLAQMADVVTEVVYGVPMEYKNSRKRGPEKMPLDSRGRKAGINHMEEENNLKYPKKDVGGIKLVTGGACQGKSLYARREFGGSGSGKSIDKKSGFIWIDGETCGFEEIYTCNGIFHFELLIRRMLKGGTELSGFAREIARRNQDIVIVSSEIGCGLVPMGTFERQYRETAGRVLTEIAGLACRVDRVVCGIGTVLKGGEEE
ncbi:bifunctional adenosylcobinamide kinase/adenosylcobinamide-phosphate guanylyltransferase [Luxibacter massiliensis]|uniref:bifunctional adenosylcobinamide kinase/adenosylcobinamide-phosphate guanylyltransferase n=1 Tax=Luxibacter massiliensis TaxID=2219695 RepID=UPI000F06A118|nr:bifunctional adenosylcobinamide kinase/adenosylcobinamide-phosphate guanylyltransferase [Luxibacter massiliensis]